MISDLTMGGEIELAAHVCRLQPAAREIVYAKLLALGAWILLFAHVRVSA